MSIDRHMGYREASKAAVAWMHREADAMNDPHARAVLNCAAHGLGIFLKEGRQTGYQNSPKPAEREERSDDPSPPPTPRESEMNTPTPPSIVERQKLVDALRSEKYARPSFPIGARAAMLAASDLLDADAATIRELAEALRGVSNALDTEGYKPEAERIDALLSRLNLEGEKHG